VKFSINRCRQILGEVGKNLTDKEIEEIRDCFVSLSDFIIEGEIKKLRCKQYERSNKTTIPKS
jgi:hypothetical protein